MSTDEQNSNRAAVVEARLAALQAVAGHRLEPADLELMRERIDRMTQLGSDVRSIPLDNGDHPGHTFIPFRAEEIKG